MHKRVGEVEIDSSEDKNSLITIRVFYNNTRPGEVILMGYDELCDLEYLIKSLKRRMEE